MQDIQPAESSTSNIQRVPWRHLAKVSFGICHRNGCVCDTLLNYSVSFI